jgi:cyclase
MKKKMFGDAHSLIFNMARKLRGSQTHAESLLWNYLKAKPFGFKFRRQHPYSVYIFDFYCHSIKLVIEVDGSIHDVLEIKQNDELRQRLVEKDGITVIRFSNEKVVNKFEEVIDELNKYLVNQK